VVAIVLLLFDFGINNYWINPLIQSELYEPAPAAAYLQERWRTIAPFRVFKLDTEGSGQDVQTLGETNSIVWSYFYRKLTLAQFLAAKDHISFAVFQPVDRLETLPSQRIHQELSAVKSLDEKLRFLAGLNVAGILATHDIDNPLVVLDSKFPVNSPQPLRLYRLTDHLPRAFLAQSRGPANGELTFQDQLTVGGEGTGAEKERAQVISYRPNQVEIESETTQDRLLVLLDSYYPGWKAWIDGTSTPVVAANFVYRAVDLPRGKHHVTFRYECRPFARGLRITACTILAWTAVWFVHRFRVVLRSRSKLVHA